MLLGAVTLVAFLLLGFIATPLGSVSAWTEAPGRQSIMMAAAVGISFLWASATVLASWFVLRTIGIPIHNALQRLGLQKLWHYMAIGQLAGCAIGGALLIAVFPGLEGSDFARDNTVVVIFMMVSGGFLIALGGIAGGIFWRCLQKVPSAQTVEKPVW